MSFDPNLIQIPFDFSGGIFWYKIQNQWEKKSSSFKTLNIESYYHLAFKEIGHLLNSFSFSWQKSI
jgi:hypothetical protein